MATTLTAEQKSEIKGSFVTFQTSQGTELRAGLLRLTRHSAAFEVYNPALVMRMSDVLENFKVIAGKRTLYSGRALVSSLVNTGTLVVCEVKLEESGLSITPLNASVETEAALRDSFAEFLAEWQTSYRVRSEFKDVMGDMQGFLTDLRLWLEQVELEIRSSPSGSRQQLERKVVEELADPIVRAIDSFIERFELIAGEVEEELQPVHRAYLRRQLHPLVLCSPFAYRAFYKPLGYAGDYELVDMMMRSPVEGSTLFAKVLNVWLLGQAPARAHRNRVQYLARKLLQETARVRSRGRRLRVYDLGCGPAAEIQHFLAEGPICDQVNFTLLDFNEETLAHARTTLEGLKRAHGRATSLHFIKRSVQQLLKDAARSVSLTSETGYDFIYCAGLFDYLSTAVCKRLMNVFYEMLAPGGLLVATNVSDAMNDSRPFRHSMEYILDWHLIYRDGVGVGAFAPDAAPPDACTVLAEDTSVNIFIEVRKPEHG
ncbi:MAG TPA: class I SAM-dependent methyltransferase [Candidatus Acidoferrum sp.]|jgi:extracellular factor (EF) 3-hydroxypalmitic acid methyl ester biosynthesis protein|nr:class I SAM-dependent methyltransferase [Candidatus Acidoferrum sp.]